MGLMFDGELWLRIKYDKAVSLNQVIVGRIGKGGLAMS
jgi:hypothetical protein